jgi:ribosomal protein S18 acetylase RimI-like enzyme
MAPTLTIEALDGGDLVALAQCMALDASAFPHPSVPLVSGGVPRTWIARGERGVVGFVATAANGKALDIVGVAVDPSLRRSGIGRALVRTVVDLARERRFRAVTLNVSTANEGAIALYESEGFVAVQRMRRYYNPARFADGGDAFRMVRDIGRDLSARPRRP